MLGGLFINPAKEVTDSVIVRTIALSAAGLIAGFGAALTTSCCVFFTSKAHEEHKDLQGREAAAEDHFEALRIRQGW